MSCLICKGVGWVVTHREQTIPELATGKLAPAEYVYGVRKCPPCVESGVTIPPPGSGELVGVVHEGWADFAERMGRRRAVVAN